MTRRGSVGRLFDAQVSFISKERKMINCLGREFSAYLYVVEWIGIYQGKEWLISLLYGDTVSLLLGEEFPFR